MTLALLVQENSLVVVFSPPTVGLQGPNSINKPVKELHPGPPLSHKT